MSRATHGGSASDRRHRGMTLVEAVVGMLVISIAVGAALQATATARRESIAADERLVARALLEGTRSQLAALRYRDPTTAGSTLGAEAGESATSPSGWDDVDDANGWSGLPSILSVPGDWSVSVSVAFVDPDTPASDAASDKGLKRITMTAKRGVRIIAKQEFLREAP